MFSTQELNVVMELLANKRSSPSLMKHLNMAPASRRSRTIYTNLTLQASAKKSQLHPIRIHKWLKWRSTIECYDKDCCLYVILHPRLQIRCQCFHIHRSNKIFGLFRNLVLDASFGKNLKYISISYFLTFLILWLQILLYKKRVEFRVECSWCAT